MVVALSTKLVSKAIVEWSHFVVIMAIMERILQL